MKWPSYKEPRFGDIRSFRRFAWHPMHCDDGQTRWLCWLRVHQQFRMSRGIDASGMSDDVSEPWWCTTYVEAIP